MEDSEEYKQAIAAENRKYIQSIAPDLKIRTQLLL